MQLSGAIARNNGPSWHSGTKSNSVASSLSARYSSLFFSMDITSTNFGWFEGFIVENSTQAA
jgi:hypothetical protein